jgi:hypothetical protein
MEQLARRPRWPWASLPAEVETSLLTALSDSGDDVRYLAADALGDVRTAAVIQAIETRLAAETSPSSILRCGGQEQAGFGRLAVDTCAPGQAHTCGSPFPSGPAFCLSIVE